jgi:uncharacterized protein YjbJ (UPF0337 family)
MLNQEQISKNWNQIKGGVRNLWGEISEEELDKTKGSIASIQGLIHQHYGEEKESIREKISTLMSSFENPTDKLHLGGRSSYERNPVAERTSETSQFQDAAKDPATRGNERTQFDKRSYKASKESIDHPFGSSNNSGMNPNRETPSESRN